MKRLILGLFFISLSGWLCPASADVDYTCVNACTAQGLQYGLCTARCTYVSQLQTTVAPMHVRQTDYVCLNRCTGAGYNYMLCSAGCTY